MNLLSVIFDKESKNFVKIVETGYAILTITICDKHNTSDNNYSIARE